MCMEPEDVVRARIKKRGIHQQFFFLFLSFPEEQSQFDATELPPNLQLINIEKESS